MISMRRSPTLAGAALALIAVMQPRADARELAAPQIVNAMPAFWAFQKQIAGSQPPRDIVRRFRQEIIEPHSRIYSTSEFSKDITDAGIASYLDRVQPDLETMRLLTAKIAEQTSAAAQRFVRAFPRFEGGVSVVYLPSFYRFDGQMTTVDGKHVLLFGLDGIARYHGAGADLGVLLSHELFHAHHVRRSPALFADEEHTPVYIGVWIEGLATYVSEKLNPQASPLQILLDDADLLNRGMPLAPEIARMILECFDSTRSEDAERFLTFGDKGDIPGRSGYLPGYLIAKKLGANHTLPQLASLRGETLRKSMREELQRLAAEHTSR